MNLALDDKRLKGIVRHIQMVQQEAFLLAERLSEKGEHNFAKQLLANSMLHDNSKFHGIEWMYLNDETKTKEPSNFQAALTQHQLTNPHHPQYWQNITDMPRIYIAEMVCDIKTRSDEFGTDIREWVKTTMTKQFKITVQSRSYREVKDFLELLLDPKFS